MSGGLAIGSLLRNTGSGNGATLKVSGALSFASGGSGVALGYLIVPAAFSVFSKVSGSAKVNISATGVLTTNAGTTAGEVLTVHFRAATSDGRRAIEETFDFTALGTVVAGTLDFSNPANSGLQPTI